MLRTKQRFSTRWNAREWESDLTLLSWRHVDIWLLENSGWRNAGDVLLKVRLCDSGLTCVEKKKTKEACTLFSYLNTGLSNFGSRFYRSGVKMSSLSLSVIGHRLLSIYSLWFYRKLVPDAASGVLGATGGIIYCLSCRDDEILVTRWDSFGLARREFSCGGISPSLSLREHKPRALLKRMRSVSCI